MNHFKLLPLACLALLFVGCDQPCEENNDDNEPAAITVNPLEDCLQACETADLLCGTFGHEDCDKGTSVCVEQCESHALALDEEVPVQDYDNTACLAACDFGFAASGIEMSGWYAPCVCSCESVELDELQD